MKSPRVYVRDSGLAHALLGIGGHNALARHPVVGPGWEGFVIENLLAAAPPRTMASFHRTAAGAEIDLVPAVPDQRGLWAIEIERSLTASPGKGFHSAREDLDPERTFIVDAGGKRHPLAKGIEAIGLQRLASLLAAG